MLSKHSRDLFINLPVQVALVTGNGDIESAFGVLTKTSPSTTLTS